MGGTEQYSTEGCKTALSSFIIIIIISFILGKHKHSFTPSSIVKLLKLAEPRQLLIGQWLVTKVTVVLVVI